MKVDFSYILPNLIGEPLRDEKGDIVRLSSIAANALLVPTAQNEQKLSGYDQVLRFTLASKIVKGEEVDLTAEQITLIKERIAANYGPAITGPAWMVIDPPAI